VIARSWKDATLPVKSLAANKHSIASIKLLGFKDKIKWKADDDALAIQMPMKEMLPKAVPVYVFKVDLRN
jgi:hypothetical protein